MQIFCSNCENACSEAAAACPKCGHPLARRRGWARGLGEGVRRTIAKLAARPDWRGKAALVLLLVGIGWALWEGGRPTRASFGHCFRVCQSYFDDEECGWMLVRLYGEKEGGRSSEQAICNVRDEIQGRYLEKDQGVAGAAAEMALFRLAKLVYEDD